MKILQRKQTIIDQYTISYGKGILCDVKIVDGLLDSYFFRNKNTRLEYCTYIDKVLDTWWPKYSEELKEEIIASKLFTLDELHEFTEFENLYYIGGGSNGIVTDNIGKILPSKEIVDHSSAEIYLRIKKEKKALAYLDIISEIDWITDAKLSRSNGRFDESPVSIEFSFKLPPEMITKNINSNGAMRQIVFDLLKEKYQERKKTVV